MMFYDFYELIKSSFFNSLFVPLKDEYVYPVLLIFNNYPGWQLFTIALLFSLLASVITWFVPRQIMRFEDRAWFKNNRIVFDKAGKFFNRYLLWMILLNPFDVIGNPTVIAAGIFKTPFRKVLALLLIGKILYYSYFLLKL